MIRLRDLRLETQEDHAALRRKAADKLRIDPAAITEFRLLKKSLDARKKQDIHYTCTVALSLPHEEKYIAQHRVEAYRPFHYSIPRTAHAQRPVVVGFGPAGMFCALVLARAGLKPIVLERGECVEKRMEKVQKFWAGGALDPESNVQFGEGGAGTFSDGKLNTGTNDPRIAWVLAEFARHGADESITYDAKPHIGTDVLMRVVKQMREEIRALGGEILFSHRFCDFIEHDHAVTVTAQNGDVRVSFETDCLVLALGHSSRDTFTLLHEKGISMEPKAFSMGVRIEHPQSLIDRAQYGEKQGLPPADYKLNCRTQSGSAYTFCMCPGGYVVAAASEPESIVTNGMSNRARDAKNANAALLVSVTPEDFPDRSPLAGMYWQREIERRAYAVSHSYCAPAQRVGDFLAQRPSNSVQNASYRPGVVPCDLRTVLPQKIVDTLVEALPVLGKKLKGFDHPDAVLTAPETRSSSPVRIPRDASRTCSAHIYPCGEGAGYAGGITSAAVDGMRTAEAILDRILILNGGTPYEYTQSNRH